MHDAVMNAMRNQFVLMMDDVWNIYWMRKMDGKEIWVLCICFEYGVEND